MHISIPEPCHEKWDDMSPTEKGRHCAKCEKEVTDFSRMTSYEIVRTFHDNPNVCGRFLPFQLEEEQKVPVLTNPWTSWIKKLALGGLLGTTSVSAVAQDTVSTEQTTNSPAEKIELGKQVYIRVVQPEDSSLHARHLLYEADSFRKRLDLTDTLNHSFWVPHNGDMQIPDSITIWTDSTTQKVKLSDYAIVTHGPNEIVLQSTDSTWYQIIGTPIWQDDIITTGGIPPQIPMMIELDSVSFVGTIWGFTVANADTTCHMLDTIPADTANRDTIVRDTLKKQKKDLKEDLVYRKRSKSMWWWLVPAGLIFAVGLWQLKKRRDS